MPSRCTSKWSGSDRGGDGRLNQAYPDFAAAGLDCTAGKEVMAPVWVSAFAPNLPARLAFCLPRD